MKSNWIITALASALAVGTMLVARVGTSEDAHAGQSSSEYKVLPAIKHGNLSVYPVVAGGSHDTKEFITLDEGLSSGQVVVSEYGNLKTMIRRPGPRPRTAYPPGGAQVNTLALVNNSERPLILLAGEIVMGGNQDRVIAKDRVVAPESDPIDLSVFCVEPGRWVGQKATFAAGGGMLAPTVRARAMNDKSQQQVWAAVRSAQSNAYMAAAGPSPSHSPNAAAGAVVGGVPGGYPGDTASGSMGGVGIINSAAPSATSSYPRAMAVPSVAQKVDSVAAPVEQGYRSLMGELRDKNAVGVVVAVNGQIVWADIFASTDLLQRYWPKLVRSYAAEAVVSNTKWSDAGEKTAQAFVDSLAGGHQTVESEPGLYRQTELTGDGFRVFELTSLLPKTGFNLHIAKAVE
ncbi:MAG: DUF6569 family protein [Candidatus Acidiferrales bacterium]